METKTETPFAANNLEPGAETCIHCGQTRSGHSLITAACRKAGYYGNHFDPVPTTHVTVSIPNDDLVWQYGTRWETAEGHTDEWWSSEKFARDYTSNARGNPSLVRRMLITGPAEVVL
ncbi:hypothetical protein SAMN05428985_11077 [Nocardioides sp. YR527]|uniref:hypothetical protein n=1 Tax=Nocardioides sp. YR527 TaxID=1881028 RepID=UPI00088AE0FB|nr:hypothetical protein [Nocardioides sp. YR527]SDL15226.1 hypothetical protein SAMN05428985_11077 [Nocardioides sp. YR527]